MLCNIQFSILRIGFLWSTPRILRQLAYHHIIYYYQIQLCYKDFKNYFIYKCLNIISRTIRRSLVYAQWIKIWPSHFSSEKNITEILWYPSYVPFSPWVFIWKIFFGVWRYMGCYVVDGTIVHLSKKYLLPCTVFSSEVTMVCRKLTQTI